MPREKREKIVAHPEQDKQFTKLKGCEGTAEAAMTVLTMVRSV
jgi:hypothetical protein